MDPYRQASSVTYRIHSWNQHTYRTRLPTSNRSTVHTNATGHIKDKFNWFIHKIEQLSKCINSCPSRAGQINCSGHNEWAEITLAKTTEFRIWVLTDTVLLLLMLVLHVSSVKCSQSSNILSKEYQILLTSAGPTLCIHCWLKTIVSPLWSWTI